MQPLNNFWKELIVAITPGFAGIGSLLAGTTADRYGRKPLIILSSIIFTIGAILCAVAFDKWLLLFGRVLLGLAIGFASMIVPVYVSESSPTHIRGASLATFNAMITFGQMAANIFAGLFAFINPDYVGWRKVYHNEEAWIKYELSEISASIEEERQCENRVNFIGTVIPLFLVEKLGRKKILLISSFGVIVSLCMMGGAFLLVNQDTAATLSSNGLSSFNSSVKNFDHCESYSNCDYCVTDDRCGFCAPNINGKKVPGFCLPINPSGAEGSTTGYCSSTFSNSSFYEWGDVYCKTKYTPLPIIIMVVYLLFFACGMSPVPWILNAEFYPLWARSTAVSISTSTNWFINLFVSLTFLSLTEAITKYGTFFFYAGCTFIGTIIFILFVPETKDKSLDEIEALFMTKKSRKEFEAKRNQINPDFKI
uniref:Major facilitator superfamily (MFS) profile domain-containing protein n=1 Tax=Panagrolaimus davidi TaxID=227884 RepID=A0A914QYG2_9BILA